MYADSIYGAIYHNTEDADEICQDVFVKVWKNSDRYSASKGRFFTWLLNIARNAAIDRLRSKAHKNENKTIWAGNMCNFDDKFYDSDDNIDPIGLDHMLDCLTEKNKQVIFLVLFKGIFAKGNFRPIGYSVGHRKDTK